MKAVNIYTDGACSNNPGKGGYGAIVEFNGVEKIISEGFSHTTNNRMEIMAAIAGLEALKEPCQVSLFSDSKYLVDAMSKGWAKKWQANNWRRSTKEYALNPDLWQRMLELCGKHKVEFIWVRGHNGHPQNERCDRLAVAAIASPDLKVDKGYV